MFIHIATPQNPNPPDNKPPNIGDKIKITVPVPETLPAVAEGYTRQFFVIRVHDGVAEELETTVADGNVTFTTDKFSTYAITYQDVKNTKNPGTGDSIVAYVAMFAIATVSLVVVSKRKIK